MLYNTKKLLLFFHMHTQKNIHQLLFISLNKLNIIITHIVSYPYMYNTAIQAIT